MSEIPALAGSALHLQRAKVIDRLNSAGIIGEQLFMEYKLTHAEGMVRGAPKWIPLSHFQRGKNFRLCTRYYVLIYYLFPIP